EQRTSHGKFALMTSPVFSIVMPAYNASCTIAESIESVLLQNYQDYELIIVNDCSDDTTASIATSYAQRDPRIAVVTLPARTGVANARNVAIERAKGRYITFLDSDDLWESEKLQVQLALFGS